MLDDIHNSRVLSNTTHADSMSTVAPQVLHEDIGGIGLGREAVVAHVHPGVGDAEAVNIERVEAVAVLRQRLIAHG